MKHLFILNPNSYRNLKKRDALIHRIEAACEGLEHEIYVSTSADDAQAKAASAAAAGEEICVYACGGDGCVHKVAEAIFPYENAILSVIPGGTGNDFVRTFGGKQGFLSLEHIKNGEVCRIDVIKANDHICANMLNIGFDESVVRRVAQLRRFPLMTNSIAYTIGVLIQLIKYPKENLRITYPDGSVFQGECLLSYIANGKYCGGGYNAASKALPDDGLADVLTVKPVSRLTFLSLVDAYKKGTLLDSKKAEKYTYFRQTPEMVVEKPTPFFVCIDGETIECDRLDVKVLPKAMRFKYPAGGFVPTEVKKETIQA